MAQPADPSGLGHVLSETMSAHAEHAYRGRLF